MLSHAEKSCLIVVDMQEHLARRMPTRVYSRVFTGSRLLLQVAELLGIPCIVSLQYPKGLGQLDPALEAHLPPGTPRVEKTCFSCARVEGLMHALEDTGRNQVCLTGMEAHICITQTALELQGKGYKVCVVEDAICSRKREAYENATLRLRQAGVELLVTESLVFEWLGDAKHEHFKPISRLSRALLHKEGPMAI